VRVRGRASAKANHSVYPAKGTYSVSSCIAPVQVTESSVLSFFFITEIQIVFMRGLFGGGGSVSAAYMARAQKRSSCVP